MRRILLCACFVLSAFGALAQPRDCSTIANPAERLKCFDQPRDCKTVSDSAERLKCFDAQSSTPPAAAPAAAPAPPQEPPAFTAQILKTEPPIGQLPQGAKVLIDDGTCPAGQLKQVIGGNVSTGQTRIRSCVPRS
jgi:hypothetical protein